MTRVKKKLDVSRELRGMRGKWPHLASERDGDELGKMAERKEFFEPQPVPGYKFKFQRLMKQFDAKKECPTAVRVFNFIHGQRVMRIESDQILNFMRAHFDSMMKDPDDGAFVGIHQKPDNGVYPFFIDFDENNVSSRHQLIEADEFIESEVAVLMEAIFPKNRWWWCRPTHPRKKFVVESQKGKDIFGNYYEQRKRVYDGSLWKCGIHVYTDAYVTTAHAKVIWTWMHGFFKHTLNRLSFMEMDDVTFTRTGLRSLYTYKSMPCSDFFRLSGRMRCPTDCPRGCRDLGYLLDGPMYTLRPEYRKFEIFLFSSLYSPVNGKVTPVAPNLQPKMEEALSTFRKAVALKDQVFQMKGIRMDEFEKDGNQLKNDPVINTLVRLVREHSLHPKSTEIGRITRLNDGAYVVNMNSRVCMMKTMAANLNLSNPYRHESSNNFYLISPKDGLIYLRCRSTKQDNFSVCQKKTNPIGQIESEKDGKDLFGKDWTCSEETKRINRDEIFLKKVVGEEFKITQFTDAERRIVERSKKKIKPFSSVREVEEEEKEPEAKKPKLSDAAAAELKLIEEMFGKN